MNIDWEATGGMLAGAGTLLGALTLLAAALIGRSTVKDLRASRAAERKFELTEKILEHAFLVVEDLRTNIWLIRIYQNDGDDNLLNKQFGELAKKLGDEAIYDMVSSSLENARKRGDELNKLRPLASFHFNDDVAQKIEVIVKQAVIYEKGFELFKSIQDKSKLYSTLADVELEKQFEDALKELKKVLTPHLGA